MAKIDYATLSPAMATVIQLARADHLLPTEHAELTAALAFLMDQASKLGSDYEDNGEDFEQEARSRAVEAAVSEVENWYEEEPDRIMAALKFLNNAALRNNVVS